MSNAEELERTWWRWVKYQALLDGGLERFQQGSSPFTAALTRVLRDEGIDLWENISRD